MTPDTSGQECEKIARQLHEWYLEACQAKDAQFNPDAQKPYDDLPEGSKFLDRYIAGKVASLIRSREEAVRREVVEKAVSLKLSWKHPLDKSIPFKTAYNSALDDLLASLTQR